MDKVFALVDCDCFYVSCERVFQPSLDKAICLVLSNNDGCAIARSDEAKALGIKMGDPLHLIKDKIKEHKVVCFSSNYTLYGDMSSRVMNTLASFTPDLEVYSIDEAFLRLDGCPSSDLLKYSSHIRATVKKLTGIPTCVGLGPNKSLAKIANKLAKKTKKEKDGGVFSLCEATVREEVLAEFPVADVWGIGKQSALKLKSYGIYTAKELRDANPALVQKLLTIVGHRIQMELKGASCLPLSMIPADRKQIVCSKSFGKPVTSLEELSEALSVYVGTASSKLRMQKGNCASISVFLETNPFKNTSQYHKSGSVELERPSSDVRPLTAEALKILRAIFKEGYEYKKVGISLNDISLSSSRQLSLFEDKEATAKEFAITTLMDSLNKRMGKETLKLGSAGTKNEWKMRQANKSADYTTSIDDILKVK